MIAFIPLIAAIGGVLAYVLATNPKVQEIGRSLFWSGFFLTLASLANHAIRVLPTPNP